MTPAELRAALTTLGLSQEALGRFLGAPSGRTVRRWIAGTTPVPVAVAKLLRVMMRHALSPADVD